MAVDGSLEKITRPKADDGETPAVSGFVEVGHTVPDGASVLARVD